MKRTLVTLVPVLAILISLTVTASLPSLKESLEVTVNYGDAISKFDVRREGEAASLTFTDARGTRISKPLASNDVTYLISKLKRLQPRLVTTSSCERAKISVSAEVGGKTLQFQECLQAKGKKELRKLVNLLATWATL